MGQPVSRLDLAKMNYIYNLAKKLSSATEFEDCSIVMFDDGVFNHGRMEVWYCFAHAMWEHLPISEHMMLDRYVRKWFIHFLTKLPEQKNCIQEMQSEWEGLIE